MSLWVRRKDKQGRVHFYLVGVPWLPATLAILGVTLAILLPLLYWLRGLLF